MEFELAFLFESSRGTEDRNKDHADRVDVAVFDQIHYESLQMLFAKIIFVREMIAMHVLDEMFWKMNPRSRVTVPVRSLLRRSP